MIDWRVMMRMVVVVVNPVPLVMVVVVVALVSLGPDLIYHGLRCSEGTDSCV
jgi:hypothetical protein